MPLKKKILIIGKNGFFGRSLKYKLSNHTIKLIGRKNDLNKIDLKNFDFIINCAADIYNEREMFKSNTFLVYKLLENYINQKSKAKIIHFGSTGEYGNSKISPSENSLLRPNSVYTGTKAAATMLLQSFSNEFKIPCLILRTFTVYGPYENQSRLIPFIFRSLILKKKLDIYYGYQDYFYIDDLCNIINKIINKWNIKSYGEILNLGSGKVYKNSEILKICEKITKLKSKVRFIKKFSESNHNKYYNYDQKPPRIRFKKYLNFKNITNIEEGIKNYWVKINQDYELKKHTMTYKKKFFVKW